MLMMWLGFWLFYAIGGASTSWYAFPFFITFFSLFAVELIIYAGVIGLIYESIKGDSK